MDWKIGLAKQMTSFLLRGLSLNFLHYKSIHPNVSKPGPCGNVASQIRLHEDYKAHGQSKHTLTLTHYYK